MHPHPASGAACLHHNHSAPNCSMVSVGNQESPRPQAHLELVARSLLHKESLHMWERLLAPACFLTTGAKSKCIGSCFFYSFLPERPSLELTDNQFNFTSDKQRGKRREMQRTQNKSLPVSLSKQARKQGSQLLQRMHRQAGRFLYSLLTFK